MKFLRNSNLANGSLTNPSLSVAMLEGVGALGKAKIFAEHLLEELTRRSFKEAPRNPERGLAEMTGIPRHRIREIGKGGELSEKEFYRLIHAFPSLKAFRDIAPIKLDNQGPAAKEYYQFLACRRLSEAFGLLKLSNKLAGSITPIVAMAHFQLMRESKSEVQKREIGALSIAFSNFRFQFGELLQGCRLHANLTTAQLALKVKVRAAAVNEWERCTGIPTLVNYNKLIEIFPCLDVLDKSHLLDRDPRKNDFASRYLTESDVTMSSKSNIVVDTSEGMSVTGRFLKHEIIFNKFYLGVPGDFKRSGLMVLGRAPKASVNGEPNVFTGSKSEYVMVQYYFDDQGKQKKGEPRFVKLNHVLRNYQVPSEELPRIPKKAKEEVEEEVDKNALERLDGRMDSLQVKLDGLRELVEKLTEMVKTLL